MQQVQHLWGAGVKAKDDGGSAFPFAEPPGGGCGPASHLGMTLRDYFAAEAAGSPAIWERARLATGDDLTYLFGKTRTGVEREHVVAAISYRLADAMLAERAK